MGMLVLILNLVEIEVINSVFRKLVEIELKSEIIILYQVSTGTSSVVRPLSRRWPRPGAGLAFAFGTPTPSACGLLRSITTGGI